MKALSPPPIVKPSPPAPAPVQQQQQQKTTSGPSSIVTYHDEEVNKIKKEIASLREQEDILMNAIVCSDPSVAQDLQVTLDVISLNISKLQEKLKKEESSKVCEK